MKPTSFQNPSTSKGKFSEPPPKPTFSSGCELRPDLIAMVRAQPFSGHNNENPCQHLHEFEEMCSCLSISGMTQETLRWKLFSFSLIGKAKQWYTLAVQSTNGDWDKLKTNFVLHFSICLVSTLYLGQSLTLNSMRMSLYVQPGLGFQC